MNLFGKKKAATGPPPPPVDAIRELRNQLVILEKRDNLMQQRIAQTVQEALKKKSKRKLPKRELRGVELRTMKK